MVAKSDPEALEESRNEIRTLQAEYSKKKEDLERKERQRKQADAELRRRQDRLMMLESELQTVSRRSVKTSAEGHVDLAEQAQNDFMDKVVADTLKGRVPIMKDVEGAEDAGAGRLDAKEQKAEDQKAAAMHDTVLVSYTNINSDDYQVAYRIDKYTTVDQLHRDACSYWGCSHGDYVLCRTTPKEEVEALWSSDDKMGGRRREKLQIEGGSSEAILDATEKSQLHLVSWPDLETFVLKRKQLKDLEAKILQDLQARDTGPNTIKTLKHGQGFAANEVVLEPHIEAMRQWPGVYQMLKKHKSKAQRDQKWTRVRFSDLMALILLIGLSILVHSLRSQHGSWELRNGVVETLGVGLPQGPLQKQMMSFNKIELYDDIWEWFNGLFLSELYDGDSTLRQFYKPVGYMRIRQQIANRKDCADRVIPFNLKRRCYFIEVNDDTQDKETMRPERKGVVDTFMSAAANSGRMATPDPFVWQPASAKSFSMYGYMQNRYDGSGFSIVYNTSASTGKQVAADLAFIKEAWVKPQTRMLIAEVTFANYNLGGYVSANFLLEISPSGAVKPDMDIKSFTVYHSYWAAVAEAVDIVRWFLVIGYMFLLRIYSRTRAKMAKGKTRFSYVMSLSGLTDVVIAGLFVAIQVIFLKDDPPKPESLTAFYTFLSFAHDLETLSIMEAVFILTCLLRLSSFARLNTTVYGFYKVFSRSVVNFGYFACIFIPVLCGVGAMAHALWSPYIELFSTYTLTLMSVMLAIYQPFEAIEEMYQHGGGWTLPFLVYFVLVIGLFMVNMFLAITVHAFWEVELLEADDATLKEWSHDQWLDWALWAPVYGKLTGRKPGASRIRGFTVAEEDDGSSSSGSGSDEER